MKLSMGLVVVLGSVAMACAAPSADEGAASGQEQAQTECSYRGYDCSVSGQMCTAKCYDTDADKDAFVKFSAAGRTVDSRSVPYTPVLSLSNVLVYGCQLWDFSDKTHQGLGIQYKKLVQGALFAGDPSDFQDDMEVYVPSFTGPGHYEADAHYTASDEAKERGEYFRKAGACSMDVASDGAGGVKGHFSCDAIPSKNGASISMSGDFACGGSALAPIFSRLP